jgi:protein gp37
VAERSKIEWTDATWTPIKARRLDDGKVGVHCERVSPACKNCYSATFNRRRLTAHGTGLDFTIINREKVEMFVDQNMLERPLLWSQPRTIFVCSQTDLFGEFVTDDMIHQVFAIMALCQQHTFQVLTKRENRLQAFMRDAGANRFLALATINRSIGFALENPPPTYPLPNVWLGVTAENQEWADKRIPVLLQTPAAKRFVSFEPMLGPIVIDNRHMVGDEKYWNFLTGERGWTVQHRPARPMKTPALDWAICGGESGHGARPMQLQWARSLRDQCQSARVPFFFKQWGVYRPRIGAQIGDRDAVPNDIAYTNFLDDHGKEYRLPVFRANKHSAGRLLDGREWSEFPVKEQK